MFERFSERARRVIFFGRYEASEEGDPYIRCIHLLLGIGREDPQLLQEAGLSAAWIKQTKITLGKRTRAAKISPSVEVPLDEKAKGALIRALALANDSRSTTVETVHILGGLFHSDVKLKEQFEQAGLTKTRLADLFVKYRSEPHLDTAGSHQPQPQASVFCGIAYDLHRLEAGRKLILGGVKLEFDKGPAGHSDGDVLAHAICDALLGAAGAGDIGTHFPDTDAKWKGVSSLVFLEHARKLIDARGLRINHIDAVVIAERPKLVPHFPAIKETLARALGIQSEQINLKAKTNEGVDAIGRGEAIAAHAIATLEG